MVFKRGEEGRDEKRKSSVTIRGDRAYYPAGITGSCLRTTFAASHVLSTQQLLLEEFSMDTTLFQRFPLFSLTVCQKWGGELSTPGVKYVSSQCRRCHLGCSLENIGSRNASYLLARFSLVKLYVKTYVRSDPSCSASSPGSRSFGSSGGVTGGFLPHGAMLGGATTPPSSYVLIECPFPGRRFCPRGWRS